RRAQSRSSRYQGCGSLFSRNPSRQRLVPPTAVVFGNRSFAESIWPRIRGDLCRSNPRSRRVLFGETSIESQQTGETRNSASVCRTPLAEAVLPIRGEGLARRRPRTAHAGGKPPLWTKSRMDTPAQPRRSGDARQMGIPVVRCLGPRLPNGDARANRSAA